MAKKQYDNEIDRAFGTIQTAVTLGRKLKTATKVSFKERRFLFHVFIPIKAFSLMFSMNRESGEAEKVIRFLLRATEVYIEEEAFDTPLLFSGNWDRYQNYAGTETDEETGITATLWTEESIW